MAWEEESIDGGADFEEVGGKKNLIKMILLVVVGLAVLGGIGYAVYFFFLQDKPEEEGAEGAEAEVAEVQEEPEPETGFKVDLEKFTLNLADKGNPRYLVASISLEVSTEEMQTAMTDENDPKLYRLKSRDQILQILRAKTSEDINDPNALRELSKEIEFKLNRIYKEGKILNVYFGEFVMQ
jgi:flagellar FliL protein